MAPSADRRVTRATNAEKHPGRIVKKTRRTKAEMELAREVSQREKETVKLRRKESVASVASIARLEDEMAVYDANVGGAHPRSHRGNFHSSLIGVELIQNLG